MESPPPRKMTTRARVIWLAVVAAAIAVAVLVALIGAGRLVLPGTSTAPFSVTVVHWTINQGTAAGGEGWLGASHFNYTIGYPAAFSPGGTISLLWSFANHDSSAHSIISAIPNAPFTFVSASPTLPVAVAAGLDDAALQLTFGLPDDAGGSLPLNITVNVI